MMRLAGALVHDGINEAAIDAAKAEVCALLSARLEEKREEQHFADQVRGRAQVTYGARVYDLTRQEYVDTTSHKVAIAPENISDLFDEVGRKVGEGLHRDFWERAAVGIDNVDTIRHTKIEVAVLLSDPAVVSSIEGLARNRVDAWRARYVDQIDRLPEKRRSVYAAIAGMASEPSKVPIRHPNRVAWKRPEEAPSWPKHIYVDSNGVFADHFNLPETATLNSEIPNCLGWLRNLDRKPWSLAVPYQRSPGKHKPLYPDFLFFRQQDDRIVIDIIDPHGSHLPDAVTKAKGLALYAEQHGHRFGRIEILDWIDGQLRRLDLKDHSIRNQINAVANSDGLTALYRAEGS